MGPENPSADAPRGCLRTVLTFIAIFVAGGTLLILPTGFLGLAFVLGGGLVLALFSIHYFVWGRLMNLELQDPDQPSDDQNG